MEKTYCKETKTVHEVTLIKEDLNSSGTMFGGRLLEILDRTCGISASRFAEGHHIVTASVDRMDFHKPLTPKHIVSFESFVSGANKSSVEVFAKVLGRSASDDEAFLAATAFFTFVVTDPALGKEFHLPELVPQSEEEIGVCSGYEKRRRNRMESRKLSKEAGQFVSLEAPWS